MLGVRGHRQPAVSGRRQRTTSCQPVAAALPAQQSRCWGGGAQRNAAAAQQPSSRRSVLPLGYCQRVRGSGRGTAVKVFALDAAQPFDFEGRMQTKISKDKQLKIGIVGFGTFGQFLARRMIEAGHRVLATSRTPYYQQASEMGAEFYEDPDDFCEEHPDVVILATSILSTEPVLRSLPLARLKRSTLVVDVLSVKVFPKQLLLSLLPPELDILCTHPMFGPDSGKGAWTGLNFMYDPVRVGKEPKRQQRLESFLSFFRQQGCRMVDMTCEEHDRQAASTQFVTHTVGRMLGAMELTTTEINTKGFEALLQLVENTNHDSFDLYYGLFLYNTNATDELERLEKAFDVVKKQLFGRLHAIARKSLLPDPAPGAEIPAPSSNGGGAPSLLSSRSSSASSSDGDASSTKSGDGGGGSGTSSNSSSVSSLPGLSAAAGTAAMANNVVSGGKAVASLQNGAEKVAPSSAAANGTAVEPSKKQ